MKQKFFKISVADPHWRHENFCGMKVSDQIFIRSYLPWQAKSKAIGTLVICVDAWVKACQLADLPGHRHAP
ncbi:hypothetical protein [Thiofilum flexile]|uniref:hypothetical protein n=1 Tax=Thiofilum flexile TaxID=125627 RepID=UPI00037867D3|nr:hypothetical protein [Thiofilum flexile]